MAVIHLLFWAYYIVLFARVIMSWLPLSGRHPLMRTLGPPVYALTEPLLGPIRRLLRRHLDTGPVDLSPFALYLCLMVLERIVGAIVTRVLALG